MQHPPEIVGLGRPGIQFQRLLQEVVRLVELAKVQLPLGLRDGFRDGSVVGFCEMGGLEACRASTSRTTRAASRE